MVDSKPEVEQRLRVAKALLHEFKLERWVYVSVIVVCIVILLVTAVISLIRENFNYSTAVGLFGPSGGMVAMIGLLQRQSNKVMELVLQKEVSS